MLALGSLGKVGGERLKINYTTAVGVVCLGVVNLARILGFP